MSGDSRRGLWHPVPRAPSKATVACSAGLLYRGILRNRSCRRGTPQFGQHSGLGQHSPGASWLVLAWDRRVRWPWAMLGPAGAVGFEQSSSTNTHRSSSFCCVYLLFLWIEGVAGFFRGSIRTRREQQGRRGVSDRTAGQTRRSGLKRIAPVVPSLRVAVSPASSQRLGLDMTSQSWYSNGCIVRGHRLF